VGIQSGVQRKIIGLTTGIFDMLLRTNTYKLYIMSACGEQHLHDNPSTGNEIAADDTKHEQTQHKTRCDLLPLQDHHVHR